MNIIVPTLFYRPDTAFLLKFLRASKFSQLRARTMMEGYLGLKIELPFYYNNWDPCDPVMSELFKAG